MVASLAEYVRESFLALALFGPQCRLTSLGLASLYLGLLFGLYRFSLLLLSLYGE